MEKARKTSIIIFNEAHYNPRNRIFVISMLDALRKIGYTVFAAEAFSNNSNFYTINHPQIATGTYTCEPQYANMVRKAKSLGYHLLPYEGNQSIGYQGREMEQDRNISTYLSNHPTAKIIVYCGFGHVYEVPIGKNKQSLMAHELKNMTHIDSFTVDQVYLGERSIKELERPERQLLNANNYNFFVDKNGKIISSPYTDAALYIPDTKLKFNRPSWIFENGMVPLFIPANKVNIAFPIIVKVFLKSDDTKKTVPIDVLEIENKSKLKNTTLSVFPHSNFIIEISNEKKEKLSLINP